MALTIKFSDAGLIEGDKRWVKVTITPTSGSDYGTYSVWADSSYSSTYIQQSIYTAANLNLTSTKTFSITSTTTYTRYFWLAYAGSTSYEIELRNSSGTVFGHTTYTDGMSGGGGSATTQYYYVEYNSNNGEDQSKTQSVLGAANSTIGVPVWKIKDTGFTIPTYKTFSHWNTNSKNTGTDYDPGDTIYVTAGTKEYLYAIWDSVQQTLSITYHKNDGSGTTKTIDYTGDMGNVQATLSHPNNLFANPSVSGKTFSYWYLDERHSYEAGETVTLPDDWDLYAIWSDKASVRPVINTTKTSKTTSSITIYWTVNASYGETYAKLGSTEQGNTTIISSGTTYSATFSGLSSNTSYKIYVYHENGGNSSSTNTTIQTNVSKFYWTNNDSNNIKQDQPISNITYKKWNALQNLIRTVSIRKGSGDVAFTEVEQDDIIYAETDGMQEGGTQHQGFNNLRKRISNLGVASENLPQTVTSGADAKAEYFIKLRDAMNKVIDDVNSST